MISLFAVSVTRASELVGRVVGARYRLLRPLGSGASAHVYVAEDVRLRRRIAIKVLHPGLAQDVSFLRRFEAEAQTVAALRHPGIVRVYDWGDDGQDAYLAMELLEGGSLRALLDTGYRLSVSQAAALALDIAAALAYAHARGLVHRDIKPANLLFDEEGHASVVDFGIARALAEASWTEPMGGLIGTARYAAPEQLTGQPLDGKADVYSLALVLVEAVTGQAPFAKDTTLAALMARAAAPLTAPPGLGSLGPVIDLAGALAPEERLTAEGMGEEIALVARGLRAPAPLPLGRRSAAVEDERGPQTLMGPEEQMGRHRPSGPGLSVMAGDLELVPDEGTQLGLRLPAEDVPPPMGRPEPPHPPAPDHIGGGPGDAATYLPRRAEARLRVPPARRRRVGRWVGLAVVLALIAAGGAGAAIYLSRPPPPPPTYLVPNLSGTAAAADGPALAKERLRLVVTSRQWSTAVAVGHVISQYPMAGARLLAGRTVDVTLSLGPQPVLVPSLATLDLGQATAFLKSAGLRLGTVAHRTSLIVPAGIVITWSPAGRRLLPGSRVDVVVSLGEPIATVPPGAVGEAYDQLAPALEGLGFRVEKLSYYSTTVHAGAVLSTAPPPGSRRVVGTLVVVDVSLGPHLVTIPGTIAGVPVEQAAKALSALGLYVSRVSGSPLLPVRSSEPGIGTAVLFGSSIVLVTGQ